MNNPLSRTVTLAVFLTLVPGPLMAQGSYMGQADVVRPVPPVSPPVNYGAPTYGPQSYGTPAADSAAPFAQEELDALVAPIALYPDQLLAQVLMAATFPLDVVEAARFVQQNPNLKGAALDNALASKPWDPSVLSLAAFPQVLQMMNDRLDWTRRLGDAFLADQDRVMQTVQDLRQRAQATGNLMDTPQQQVVVEDRTIYIEPAQPQVVYVPYYDPTVVYGPWWAPSYEPFYWRPPAVYGAIGAGALGFSLGYYVTNNHWGWARPDWRSRRVAIDFDRRNYFIERRPYYREWVRDGWWQHRGDQWRDSRGGRPPLARAPGAQFVPGQNGRAEGRYPRGEGPRGEAFQRGERPRAAAPEGRAMPRAESGSQGRGNGRRPGADERAHGDNAGAGPVLRAAPPRAERVPEARLAPQRAERPPEARLAPQRTERPPEARLAPQRGDRAPEARPTPQRAESVPAARPAPQRAESAPAARPAPPRERAERTEERGARAGAPDYKPPQQQ